LARTAPPAWRLLAEHLLEWCEIEVVLAPRDGGRWAFIVMRRVSGRLLDCQRGDLGVDGGGLAA